MQNIDIKQNKTKTYYKILQPILIQGTTSFKKYICTNLWNMTTGKFAKCAIKMSIASNFKLDVINCLFIYFVDTNMKGETVLYY